jgi:hypothetical protein
MPSFRSFVTYYVRSALPFVTGLAFGLFLFRFDLPLPVQVALGMVLVVVGPLVIQTILVLLVEALRGTPGEARDLRGVGLDAEGHWTPPAAPMPSLRPPRRLNGGEAPRPSERRWPPSRL